MNALPERARRRGLPTLTERMTGAVAFAVVLALLSTAPRTASAFRPDTIREIDSSAAAYLHYSLGRLMELEGLHAEALVQYRRVLSFRPQDCEVMTAESRVLMAADRHEEALARSLEALERCPDELEATVVAAEALLALDRPAEAREAIASSLEETVGGPGESGANPTTRLIVLLGRSLEAEGRLAEAAALYEESALADTLDPELAFHNARAGLALGDTARGVAELKRSHRLMPENRTAALMLARELTALERYHEAVPVLESLVRQGESSAAIHVLLARTHLVSGDHARAAALLTDAERLWGETPLILSTRAQLLLDQGDRDAAVRLFERAYDEDPSAIVSPVSLNFLAYRYAESGTQLERALDLALRAADMQPTSPQIRDTLGWVYYRLGRLADAVRELELAVSLGIEEAVVFEHLGDAYSAIGRREEAREAWGRAIELDPDRASTLRRLSGETGPDSINE